jgi:hypothetical protein
MEHQKSHSIIGQNACPSYSMTGQTVRSSLCGSVLLPEKSKIKSTDLEGPSLSLLYNSVPNFFICMTFLGCWWLLKRMTVLWILKNANSGLFYYRILF